jgi:hypothetical protein
MTVNDDVLADLRQHSTANAPANLRRIVACVNAHDELLEALKSCVEGLRNTCRHLINNDCFNAGLDYDPCPCSLCQANRAIAKAELAQ